MEYILSHPSRILVLVWQHLELTFLSTAIAVFIGVPTGVAIHRFRFMAASVLAIAGLMYLIPSLALFAVLIPILGLGKTSAIVALVIYSLLVLIRNTYTGLSVVPPQIREAAAGIGMSRWQQIRLIDIPISLPVIMGGIRIATVMNIGITSIAAYIGAGGLGTLIFRGIATVDSNLILAGALPIAALSLIADWILRRVEELVRSGW